MIVAAKTDPKPWQLGLVYFEDQEWPVPGFTLIKRVTGCTAKEYHSRGLK